MVFKTEKETDSLLYVKEMLLEYGWNNKLARIIETTYEYNPVKERKAKENGYVLAYSKQLQFIEGVFRIEQNIFTFIPDKSDKFKPQIFRIIRQSKTNHEIKFINEENNVFIKGDCLEPMISI